MKEIRMVDLKSQYDKIKTEIDTAVLNVINSTAFINGPEVNNFQKELENYLGVKHVIPCANGTDALQIALMGLGLKPGDEVITVSFTFVATVEVIALLGYKPVFVDVLPETFNINPELIEKAITPKTKAIVPVHLFGQCADMEPIIRIAEKYNLSVVEDVAQALGSDYRFSNGTIKKAGGLSHVGCTSFFPSKNLGCYGDGGAIFTNDDELAKKLRSIVNHGMTVRYYHDDIGVNSRLDSIQAAILRIKLRHLDEYNLARRKAASFYNNAFKNNPKLTIPATDNKTTHIYHQYTLLTNNIDRDILQKKLTEKGVPAMIYYPVPLHRQKAYMNYGFENTSFPVTDDLSHRVFSLPMHTELDEEQLNFICNTVNEIANTL